MVEKDRLRRDRGTVVAKGPGFERILSSLSLSIYLGLRRAVGKLREEIEGSLTRLSLPELLLSRDIFSTFPLPLVRCVRFTGNTTFNAHAAPEEQLIRTIITISALDQ